MDGRMGANATARGTPGRRAKKDQGGGTSGAVHRFLCFLAVKTLRSICNACIVALSSHRTPWRRVWLCKKKLHHVVAQFCSLGANWAMAAAPYTMKLDAESARELAQRGGTILLLDVPENTAVGVDQQVHRAWGSPPRPFGRAGGAHARRRRSLAPPLPAAAAAAASRRPHSRRRLPLHLCCRPSWLARASRASRWCPQAPISSPTTLPAGRATLGPPQASSCPSPAARWVLRLCRRGCWHCCFAGSLTFPEL